ncbi:class I SAM-dependent methyltransferase [Pseudodesulfovibrio sp.]|uniref:class I SAM-dependent methyltransferase n=1 Tax=Pseudodesulfovibrio sp. TaxID=2035812 RepID=UPI00260EC1D2|nr:class I SAM-dependent methyltransferase [Pseudodesulfovibrio sp.]MDD3312203.1 class I SAM-dependent methyltransferase [Pseudodesulfovibrio sp.]
MQTDWDKYYETPFWASRFTRAYTTGRLVRLMRLHGPARPSILEYGGGNSCFFRALRDALSPAAYTVMDSNAKAVRMFADATRDDPAVRAVQGSVLDAPDSTMRADIVFSAGLIEHFDPAGTRRAVETHFAAARPGGLVILTFPTPTQLYRAIRRGAERLGRWAFPDERPLSASEVADALPPGASVLATGILWPLLLTQGIIAARNP